MARLGEKCDSCQVRSGCEHVTLAGNQCSAERGIEEVFLGQLPGYKLAHRRPGLTPRTRQRVGALPGNRRFRRWSAHRDRRHNFAAILRLVRHSLGIEPRHKSILDLVSVGENISLVEFDHVAEVVYPSHKAVYSARLNHVLPPPAQKFFVKTRSTAGGRNSTDVS